MSANEPLELVPASQVKDTQPPASEPAPKAEKTADTASATRQDADTGDDTAADPDGEAEKPKPKRRDHRIEEYYRLREENARDKEIIRRLAERGLDPQGQPTQTAKTGDWKSQGREPREEDFPGNYEAYLDARVEWRTEQKLTERERKAQREAQERSQAEQQEKFRERLDKGFDKYPDFEEVALSPSVQVNHTMAMVIGDSEFAADIMYHLGKNPKEADRIAALSPYAAAREIGKIEDKIAAAPAQTETVTAAPKPIRTVSGNGRSQGTSDKETIDEFMRRENEKDRKRFLGR